MDNWSNWLKLVKLVQSMGPIDGSKARVQGSGPRLRFPGSGSRLRFQAQVPGLRFQAQVPGLRFQGSGPGLRFQAQVPGLGYRDLGLGTSGMVTLACTTLGHHPGYTPPCRTGDRCIRCRLVGKCRGAHKRPLDWSKRRLTSDCGSDRR